MWPLANKLNSLFAGSYTNKTQLLHILDISTNFSFLVDTRVEVSIVQPTHVELNPILGEVWNNVIGWGWSIWPQDSLGCKNHPILPKVVKLQRFDCTSTLATQNYQILPIYTPTLSPQGFTRAELWETIFMGQISPNV